MMKVTDCTPCILNDIDLVVITTLSVYCGHKQNDNNKQTDKQNIKLPNKKKANERKEKKQRINKTKISQRVRTLDLSMSSPWRNPSATRVPILNQQFLCI